MIVFALVWGSQAQAQLTVTFQDANPTLQLGMEVQQLVLLVSNTSVPATDYSILNLELNLMVGDGTSGLKITAVDVIGPGTVFAGNNTGNHDSTGITDWIWHQSTTTGSGTDSFNNGAPMTLATITFDTRGMTTPGTLDLALTTGNGDSHFSYQTGPSTSAQLPLSFSGTISVVPEVNGAPVVALALGALALYWRCGLARRRRHTVA